MKFIKDTLKKSSLKKYIGAIGTYSELKYKVVLRGKKKCMTLSNTEEKRKEI